MLHNIKLKAIYIKRGCCYVAIFLLYIKKLFYIAHPILPDVRLTLSSTYWIGKVEWFQLRLPAQPPKQLKLSRSPSL